MIFRSKIIPASREKAGCILRKDVDLALVMMDGLDKFHPTSITASRFQDVCTPDGIHPRNKLC